jgi:hypothetical protein
MTFNPDKTEIMLFTNLEHPEINFTFEDNIISTIESHRHLGVAFNTDAVINRDAIPCRTLLKNHKRQSNSFPFTLVKLKLNYAFEEVDGVSNALVKIQSEIHISALSFGFQRRVPQCYYYLGRCPPKFSSCTFTVYNIYK